MYRVTCDVCSVRKGADVEATNRRGRGPLSFAAAPSAGAREGEAAAAVQLLLARGADAQRKDADGLTALARAQRERPEARDGGTGRRRDERSK